MGSEADAGRRLSGAAASMVMTTGAMGMAVAALFRTGCPYLDDFNVELQGLAGQGVIGIDICAVPAHLDNGDRPAAITGIELDY